MIYAPVIIPTLHRFVHLKRLIESLMCNTWAKHTDVYIGVDYPPSIKYRQGWGEICNYLDKGDFSAFASFTVIKSDSNLGSTRNWNRLTTEIQKRYDRYISLNDDIEVSPNFLEFMNKCLDTYEDDKDVVAVSGYSYPIEWEVSEGATCLKQNVCASVWGIGFWIDKEKSYAGYIRSGQMLDDVGTVIHEKRYKRMIDASLREYIPGAVSPRRKDCRFLMGISDIGLRAYLAVANKYIVSPVISKTRNLGFDGSGEFCQTINTNLNGETAGTYNYSQQPIDESPSFELVLNTKDSMDENRNRLNRFDMRTPAQMRRTRLYLWLMTHFGVWAGKTCAIVLFPFDFGLRALRKISRII